VLVYSSAPEQQLSFWFRIKKVEELPVAQMWRRYENQLGISREEAADYPTVDGSGQETLGRAQLLEAEDLLVKAGMDSNSLLNTMFTGIDRLKDIPIKDWPRVRNALSMRAARRNPPPQDGGEEKT